MVANGNNKLPEMAKKALYTRSQTTDPGVLSPDILVVLTRSDVGGEVLRDL